MTARRHRRAATWVAVVAAFVLFACVAPALAAADAQAAAKGVFEVGMRPGYPEATVDQYIASLGELGAGWTRIEVFWSSVQPNAPTATDPGYDEAYMAKVKATAAKCEAAGIKLIVTVYGVPKWASNKVLWDSPPAGYTAGEYQPFYAPDTSSDVVMTAFQNVANYLASTLGPAPYGVRHFEAWNEPNIYPYLCPQTRPGDAYFSARTYLAMLKAFSAGVKAADPGICVIGGTTAPQGGNDANLTSPQRFATYLKDNGAAQYFDAYSHHPYPWTGQAPDVLPPDPAHGVILSNISTLLAIFPAKPFYLTEFGYSTKDMITGIMGVTEAQQASYLRQSFAMIAKKRQIKALFWFQIRDTADTFTGLSTSTGVYKPSWYAFSGQNTLTLSAPALAAAQRSFNVTGKLTGKAGALRGKIVQLETRLPSQSTWKPLRSAATRKDGSYAFSSLKQGQTRYYRVSWSGVCTSVKRLVRTP